ncbi:MAG: hypothetical protein KDC79_07020 [Cyclobacteriaceae bacterium]|nr:hypothetical protein [Cyclobacteriaceae bacterium]
MNQETARYIINYFSRYMTKDESLAWRHYSSTIKLADNDNPALTKMYYKKGWLSDDPKILNLLKDGYDEFEKNTADRILKENEKEIYLNKCPKCSRLARTPKARQCRHCGYNWHETKKN